MLPGIGRAQTSGGAQLYGMVEVGAKGVKVSAFKFSNEVLSDDSPGLSGGERLTPNKVGKGYSVNTGIRNGTPEDIAATSDAVKDAIDRLKGMGVDQANILIVASSGVDNIKSTGAFDELRRQVLAKTGMTLKSVTVEEETKLSFEWVVLGARRSQVLLIDIGSGNTKGGYIEHLGDPQQRFRYFSLPYGTTSLAKKLNGLWPAEPVAHHAAQFIKEDPELLPSLRQQVATASGIVSKPRVYLVGGIVWATAVLTRPAIMASDARWVRLSPKNFAQMAKQLEGSDPYAPPIPAGTSVEARAKIEKTVENIRETFTPDQLSAGLAILQSLSDELKFSDRAAIFFATFASDAWSSQYLFDAFGKSAAAG